MYEDQIARISFIMAPIGYLTKERQLNMARRQGEKINTESKYGAGGNTQKVVIEHHVVTELIITSNCISRRVAFGFLA